MYILAHRFEEGNRLYFVKVYKDKWEEIYDPNHATTFANELEAEEWSRENTTFGEYAEGVDRIKSIIEFDKWYANGMVRRTTPLIDKTISKIYNNESPLEILDWTIKFTKEGHDIRYEDYSTWPHLYSVFSHIHDMNTYFKDNTKYSFQMYVNKGSKLEKFKEELNIILPHITYEEEGYKYISIFDYHCGCGGNFVYFYYKNDDDCYLASRYDTKVKGNLEKVFKYWKKERYYSE